MREGIRGEQGEGNEGVCGWVGGSLMYTETYMYYCTYYCKLFAFSNCLYSVTINGDFTLNFAKLRG